MEIGSTRAAVIVAGAAGLCMGALTDALLALAGAATITGVQIGVVALPLLIGAASPQVRRAVATEPARALVAFGAAWTLAPLIDQHLTGAVLIDGPAADVLHHVAGWVPLLIGAQIAHPRPHESLNP